MQRLLKTNIPGTDPSGLLQIPTPTQAVVRNYDCTKSVCSYILCCKCVNVSLCSACSTDKFSCGCCLMVQEVNRLKTYFNKSMTELEKDFQKTKESLRVVEGK